MPKKITSKADLAQPDPSLRVGGHDVDTKCGVLTSVDTVVQDILAAARESGLELDEATVRHVAERDTLQQLHRLLRVNQNKFDVKYNVFMHNHGAHLLIAFYKLGADG